MRQKEEEEREKEERRKAAYIVVKRKTVLDIEKEKYEVAAAESLKECMQYNVAAFLSKDFD